MGWKQEAAVQRDYVDIFVCFQPGRGLREGANIFLKKVFQNAAPSITRLHEVRTWGFQKSFRKFGVMESVKGTRKGDGRTEVEKLNGGWQSIFLFPQKINVDLQETHSVGTVMPGGQFQTSLKWVGGRTMFMHSFGLVGRRVQVSFNPSLRTSFCLALSLLLKGK